MRQTPSTAFNQRPARCKLAWTAKTRGLLVASPANPTGTLIAPAQLAELHAVVREKGGTLLVDEIYHGLTYGTEATSATELGDDIFVINSFSKYFGMTGWRLGWLVVPPAYVREFDKLSQNIYISPPTLSQHAALASFTPANLEILEARRREFSRRRDVLMRRAQRTLGFKIAARPEGAFYLYAEIGSLAEDSHVLARALLEEAGVAATPGLDFGKQDANRHMRFAYTTEGRASAGRSAAYATLLLALSPEPAPKLSDLTKEKGVAEATPFLIPENRIRTDASPSGTAKQQPGSKTT